MTLGLNRNGIRSGLLLLLALIGVRPPLAFSQSAAGTSVTEPSKAALIRQVIAASRATDQAVVAMETAIPAQRASNPRIPAVFWDRFAERARSRRGEFVELLVPVYARFFSEAELRDLLAFYQSPLGRRLLEVQPDLTREAMLAGQAWGRALGVEIGKELEAEGVRIRP